jgi:hypothetical protein
MGVRLTRAAVVDREKADSTVTRAAPEHDAPQASGLGCGGELNRA